MLDKLKELIVNGLGVDADIITPESSFLEDLGADSLDLFELIMAFEEEFHVSIPSEALEGLKTVQDVMDYISANQ